MPTTQTTSTNKTWIRSKSLKCVTSVLIQKASASQKRKSQNTSSFRKTKRRKDSTVDAAGAFRGLVASTVISFVQCASTAITMRDVATSRRKKRNDIAIDSPSVVV